MSWDTYHFHDGLKFQEYPVKTCINNLTGIICNVFACLLINNKLIFKVKFNNPNTERKKWNIILDPHKTLHLTIQQYSHSGKIL